MNGLPEALRDCVQAMALLQSWVRAGWLRDLDEVFAAFLAREAPDAPPLLLVAAALASHQLGRGHACLDLRALREDATGTLAIPPDDAALPRNDLVIPAHNLVIPAKAGIQGSPLPVLPAALLASVPLSAWDAAMSHPTLIAKGPGNTPLVRDGQRLYLRRYWQHEQSVRAGIAQRLAPDPAPPADAQVRAALDVLFGNAPPTGPADWQKIACALALRSRFTVVTGGPGTGKTTTVVKLLALLQHLALGGHAGRRLRIRLAAPTGKAAARLNTSITGTVQKLQLGGLGEAAHGEAVRAAIPTDVSTVHRLLGTVPGSRRFRHDAANRLPLDVLVLDEASMVDLETMAAVFAALPTRARLVLLGDKDQLASVEAGGVLGELCRDADAGRYQPATRQWLEAVTGQRIADTFVAAGGSVLDQAVAKLRHSYRFDAASGIGRLAEAVNQGDAEQVRTIIASPSRDLARVDLKPGDAALRRLVLEGGYRGYLQRVAQGPAADDGKGEAWARDVLKAYGEFQLLCAVRRGPYGIEGLNQRIAALLHAEELLPAATGWYAGRPVMVTENDYSLGLMNGDVGITLALPAADGAPLLRVAFADLDGAIRWVLPSRLRSVETVFAMTVHKSQGSEFGHAALLLPAARNRVLTRELVYTGITRARSRFTLALPAGGDAVLAQAVEARIHRAGGLLAAPLPDPGAA